MAAQNPTMDIPEIFWRKVHSILDNQLPDYVEEAITHLGCANKNSFDELESDEDFLKFIERIQQTIRKFGSEISMENIAKLVENIKSDLPFGLSCVSDYVMPEKYIAIIRDIWLRKSSLEIQPTIISVKVTPNAVEEEEPFKK